MEIKNIFRAGLLISFSLFCSIQSCKKPDKKNTDEVSVLEKACIVCEGNFQWGNARLDVLDIKKGTLENDAFKSANGRPLGDVFQSIYAPKDENNLYLVINNSGKIEVVNKNTLKSITTITGLNSPRYMTKTSAGEYWITDIYSGKITVLNANYQLLKTIQINGWAEQIIQIDQWVYVAAVTSGKVMIFDVDGTIKDSLDAGKGCSWLAKGKNNQLISLSSDAGKSKLITWNLTTRKLEKSIDLMYGSSKLAIKEGSDTLFFIGKGVQYFLLNENNENTYTIAGTNGINWYGLGVSPWGGYVLASDAKDYISEGEVHLLHPQMGDIAKFKSGIIPSDILFP